MYNYSHAEGINSRTTGFNSVAYGSTSKAEGKYNNNFQHIVGYHTSVKPYNIEVLSVSDGDVIICHLAKDLDFDELNSVQKEIQQYFPNNQVICANEHILESITIIKKEENPYLFSSDLGKINMDWKDLVHK